MVIKNRELIGFDKKIDIVGLTDYDMKCEAAKFANNFILQNEMTIKMGNIKYIGYNCYINNDWKVMLTEKKLIINKENKSIGISC